MAPVWSKQPFKALYAVKTALCVGFYALYYLPRPLRPVREWDWHLAVGVALYRYFAKYLRATETQRPRLLEPGKLGDRLAVAQPPRSLLAVGATASRAVEPEPVPSVWAPAPPAAGGGGADAPRVWLQFAGGAFVVGWDPEDIGDMVSRVVTPRFRISNTLYVQYRLATRETHFPAALQDAFTAYHHVLSLGIPSENIFLSGDSAGGNLVVALLRYIETSHPDLPRPGGACIFSPWIHLPADAGDDFLRTRNVKTDSLIPEFLQWGVDEYTPPKEALSDQERSSVSPFISPLHHPFRTRTPLFIQAGEREGFCDMITEFASEMSRVEGNRTRLRVSPGMPHDIFLENRELGKMAFRELEASLDDAYDFFESLKSTE